MSSAFSVSEDVKDFIKEIIAKNDIREVTDIKYQPGSQAGDGFVSRTIAVDIINQTGSFNLFLKCALNVKSTETIPMEKMHSTERHFYDVVYPAYLKFLKERGVKDGFRHAPNCYGTSPKNIVALENLRYKGFRLFDKRQLMDDEGHLALTMKTFAKFHAVSFAYKDQKRGEYDKLAENAYDYFNDMGRDPGWVRFNEKLINDFIMNLDPVKDKHILDKCDGLTSKIYKSVISARGSLNKYSILTKGDCWCNNVMYLYEEGNNTNPIDIMHIDWQVLRQASPVFDLSYFFYTIGSEEALDKLHHYLKVYYEELSRQISALGSDPENLYPYEVLLAEWKQNCLFGFGIAFSIIRVMLSPEDEVMNFEDIDLENVDQMGNLFPPLKDKTVFVNRMKALANHLVKNGFL